MIYLWRRDFSPWSCCCSTDRMCGMRVCEWTQRELTLDITFMGGDYDPGHSGRHREKDKQSQGQWERRGWTVRDAGRMKQRPWNEMRCLISPGQVRFLPVECLIWCRAYERMDTTSCTEHLLRPHIMEKGDSSSLWAIYLFVTPPSLFCPSHSCMNTSHFSL